MRYVHLAFFTCPNEECNNQWSEDRTDKVDFPYYDCTEVKAYVEECPECTHKHIKGFILSTEDLDFDENMRASLIEGRSDQESGR